MLGLALLFLGMGVPWPGVAHADGVGGWAGTGSMAAARVFHSATLLPDGKVLVAGGGFGSTVTASAELYDPRAGTWSPTGGMRTTRSFHTATLLQNGTVLVAGGEDSSGAALASAEVYTPATGAWAPTGSMHRAHGAFHTATLLPDGKVLVAGGDDGATRAAADTELYDPGTGTWMPTGSMSTPRKEHTATLLPDGRVLVAGGTPDDATFLASAEIYDPRAGTWSPTASMGAIRRNHTATLLPDGRVLVAGGDNGEDAETGAEVYDPRVGTWSPTASMGIARSGHTATSLRDGRVLVVGGGTIGAEVYDPRVGTWSPTASMGAIRRNHTATLLPDGRVLVAGGVDIGTTLSSAEVYIPDAPRPSGIGTWSPTASMSAGRSDHTATLLPGGKVLVAGGEPTAPGSAYHVLASADLYDPQAGTWSATGSMHVGRSNHTATLLPDGKVLVAGGYGQQGGGSATSSAEVYDPGTGTWAPTGDMSIDRAHHTATLLPDGRVLVAGGDGYHGITTAAELYDPDTRTWVPTGRMSVARTGQTATLLPDGRVLVAGGRAGSPTGSAEVYDPGTGTWAPTGSMHEGRAYHTATLLPDGRVLVAGGFNDTPLASAEVYDPGTGTWAPTGNMAAPRSNHTATLLPDGQVLVASGSTDASAEVYDPGTGTWAPTGNMAAPRSNHTATLLPDGQVLAVGGGTASAELYRSPGPERAADWFGRRVLGGWGSADAGGPYALYTGNGSPADFAVGSGTGAMRLATNGANRAALLPAVSARDVDERARVSFDKAPTGSGDYAYLLARRSLDGSEYRGKLHILPSGMVGVQATRVTAGVEYNVGAEATVAVLTVAPGTYVWVRLRVAGASPTTLQVKAWADGQAEPATWQYSATDSEPRLAGPGAVGLRAYLAGGATNAPVQACFDDWLVATTMSGSG